MYPIDHIWYTGNGQWYHYTNKKEVINYSCANVCIKDANTAMFLTDYISIIR